MAKIFRTTKQRQRILEILRGTNSHPNADWIYNQLKADFPKLTLGTVYRNLKLLKERGKIRKLDLGGTSGRFDGKSERHYHFVCNKCAKVFDVDMPLKHNLNKRAAKICRYNVEDHSLTFYGLCGECL